MFYEFKQTKLLENSKIITITGIEDNNNKETNKQKIKILQSIDVQYNQNFIETLGTYDIKKTGNRPILITLNSAEDVKVALKNKAKTGNGFQIAKET